MRFVVQRVSEASCTAEGAVTGSIGRGYLVLAGVSDSDTEAVADRMLDKLLKLRIFEDSEGKTNLSLGDTGGSVLLISQFTLYADVRKGNRPSFTAAGKPDHAEALYRYLLEGLKRRVGEEKTAAGRFGADMKIRLLNDGPFTVYMDSDELFAKK